MQWFQRFKSVSLLLALVITFSAAPVSLPQQSGVAQAATLADAVSQLQGVYFWLTKDTAGLNAVKDAQSKAASLDVDNDIVPALAALPLDKIVPDKFPTEQEAKEAIGQLLKDIAQTSFSTEDNVLRNITTLKNNNAETISKLLPGVNENDFIGFLTLAQSEGVKDSLSKNSGWKTIIQTKNIDAIRDLIATTLSEALQYAANHGYSSIKDAFETNGWTIQDLADAENDVQGLADTDHKGQVALLKAYVRSNAHFSGTQKVAGGEESVSIRRGSVLTGTIQILGVDVTGDLEYKSSDESKFSVSQSGGTLTVTAKEVTNSPVELTAYYSDPDTDWVYKGEVSVSRPGGGGGGGSSGTVVRTPSVQTEAATAITADSAVLNGDITSDNGYDITDYGFLWGASSSSLTNKLQAGTDDHSGDFTATLSSLTADTTYYFQAYATNSHGTAYGAVTSFTTAQESLQPTPPPTTPLVFSDVPTTFWGYDAITYLSARGIVYGYPDGTFRPNAAISRAEFVAIVVKAFDLAANKPASPDFTDVAPGAWYYDQVSAAFHAGIIKGYGDGRFAPGNPVTREEIAVMLVGAAGKRQDAEAAKNQTTGFSDDAAISAWARGFVVAATSQDLIVIKGYPDGSFEPANSATRAEASAMLANLLQARS